MNRAGMYYGARDVRVIEAPMPHVGLDDIIVKVAACGICGTDLHAYHNTGVYPPNIVIGHEFCGRVAVAGDEIRDISVGDRVTVNPMARLIGTGGAAGGMADYLLVQDAVLGGNVFKLPDSISDEEGALVEPLSVALHAVNSIEKHNGDRVAIFGAGTIGLAVLVALRAVGIEDVVVTDVSPLRLDKAMQLGASDVFNARDGAALDYLIDRFGATVAPFVKRPIPNVDTIVDCAGLPLTFSDAVRGVRHGGQVLAVAFYSDPVTFNASILIQKEIRLVGSYWSPNEFAQAVELMGSRRVDLTPLITHTFPLEELPLAFETQAKADRAVKVLVKP